ncbi:MAG TPA: UDP-N-acetylmuramoyl-tripeptide--D-alanyl-D-alanine ligase [Limnobacter sp.]|nr:UDP-N-acetylmuramoyl-tripeptide--D-alanyl-D-alanine ligase [Limnobacter sp.]
MLELNWPFASISAALSKLLVQPAPQGEQAIRLVQTDSRQVAQGDLFVCLVGERFDAHDFAAQVKASGACGLVVDRPLPTDLPQWVVQDTRLAFGALAHAWRMQFDIPVLAVVGSNGKTTTKEMLGAMCKAHCGTEHVLVTAGNLNNDIGVPQTLLKLRKQHQMAVIEMGMNHPGEIDYLAGLVKPRVALLTNAQREHQEFMKSVRAVAQENGSVFCHLPAAGTAVIPAHTEFDDLWVAQCTADNMLRFGAGADFDLVMPKRSDHQAKSTLRMPGAEHPLQTSFLGQHNANNASAAAAAAFSAGCSAHAICQGLKDFRAVNGRLQVVCNTPNLLLVNDAYNANPDSVNAASDVLVDLPGNTLMILGDMGEVGDQSDAYHREVGMYAKQVGVKYLFALGDATVHSVSGFGSGATHFNNLENLIEFTMKTLQQGSWSVLVKGSRFMKMERVVDALMMAQSSKTEGQHAS